MSAKSRLHQLPSEVRDQIIKHLVCISPGMREQLLDNHWSIEDIVELEQISIEAIKERLR